jgi:AcrR family transcriptional regulator
MAETVLTTPIPDGADDGALARSPRPPQQGRGEKRVAQILEAAESLIVERGIEAVTTNAIAERAGSSMGSLYHFFPGGKEAVIEALARKYQEHMTSLNVQALDLTMVKAPLPDLFRTIVMGMADFIAATPAFPAVHDMIMRVHCLPGGKFDDFEQAMLAQIRLFIGTRLPALPKERLDAATRLSFATVSGGVELSMRLDAAGREAVLAEVQAIMVHYMGALEREFGAS